MDKKGKKTKPVKKVKKIEAVKTEPIQRVIEKPENKTKELQIVPVQKTYDITQLERTAELFAKSGMFKDATSQAACFVKIMAGREWGINPFSAMQGINIIQGKPAMSAGLISSLIKKSGKYDYKVLEHSRTGCKLDFYEKGKLIGKSEFMQADAQLVEVKENDKWIKLNEKFVWRSYPEAMYFARALTKGARMYCPDIFDGSIYVPEELGNDINTTEITAEPIKPVKPIQKMTDNDFFELEELINTAETITELKDRYIKAYKKAETINDKDSMTRFIALKDKRKAEIDKAVKA